MTNSPIKEDFLHYLWRTKKILPHHLQTTDGRMVDVIDYGMYNTESGPDFFNAKIKINDTIWAGNIEMHIFSSDWKKHGHQYDKAYDNVILHVIYEDDAITPVKVNDQIIPTIVLKGKIPKTYLDNYLHLIQSTTKIPCQAMIKNIDEAKIDLWKYSLSIERIHQKSLIVGEVLHATGQDWEETLYIMVARYFGSKVNTEPFEILARSLPLSIINKNKNKRESIEALLFGQAGMLSANYKDDYFIQLKNEYKFLQKKYNLKPMEPVIWKFGKLRPMNFPTVRLAQFAGLMYRVSFLFSQVKEAESVAELKNMFNAIVSEYWEDHYRFGMESNHISKNTSPEFVDLLLINAVSPVLYLYGKINDDHSMIDKAISIPEHINGEVNNITKLWKSMGVRVKTAFDTQALIHLKNNYCNEYKCLSCKIGHELLGTH